MGTAKQILDLIKEKDVKYVDVRFTDVRGKLQHVTFDIDLVDDDFLNDGTMFDGSSIAGWKAINESDMKLRPDLDDRLSSTPSISRRPWPVLRRREPRHAAPPTTATRARSPRPP
jgi:glutamine synthetase